MQHATQQILDLRSYLLRSWSYPVAQVLAEASTSSARLYQGTAGHRECPRSGPVPKSMPHNASKNAHVIMGEDRGNPI